ncbi:TetR/AcrR family transcriptional regulator [Zhouia amylolytica]|uniref:Malate:quinone oxidoreductase n=1 Tax=Zhouia amylolytica AD3 TaxID=1286632 RepID=W2UNU0_9FLAO|nr:TetR/AcrR family transcriptional regulator [Zhouia amylolytica]ETN95619.1 malate:quinone oxidoreductase [Zhouia amylolytica AD3]
MTYTKSGKTTAFIIETVAPIFNKHGYAATSMHKITSATGLTKGAIYGNFSDKEELAYEAFRYNIKKVLGLISEHINVTNSPIKKLLLLIEFYKKYYELSKNLGGCPILNIGVDANNQNERLLKKVKNTISKMEFSIMEMVAEGMGKGELKPDLNPGNCAKQIFSTIEGAIFMTSTMNDPKYLDVATNSLRETILTHWKK